MVQYYLTQRGISAWQDDHHGYVFSSVRHLQQLYMVFRQVLVLELGLLVHHVYLAAPTGVDIEVRSKHVILVKLVQPLTLRGGKTQSVDAGTGSHIAGHSAVEGRSDIYEITFICTDYLRLSSYSTES